MNPKRVWKWRKRQEEIGKIEIDGSKRKSIKKTPTGDRQRARLEKIERSAMWC